MEALRHEADDVAAQIQRTEDALSELKLRQKRLLRELSESKNAVDAKLSSYEASLQMLEGDIRAFLKTVPASARVGNQEEGKQQDSLWQLPPKRRTLELAREYWTERQAAEEQRRVATETEIDALAEGAEVWSDVVERVSDFETELRGEMRSVDGEHPDQQKETMVKILRRMDEVGQVLESDFKTAEERDWKLLVCSIGAELEAFRQGKEVLQAALAAFEGNKSSDGASTDGLERQLDALLAEEDHANGSVTAQPPLAGGKGKAKAASWKKLVDDDEPDPELLISHQDTDDE